MLQRVVKLTGDPLSFFDDGIVVQRLLDGRQLPPHLTTQGHDPNAGCQAQSAEQGGRPPQRPDEPALLPQGGVAGDCDVARRGMQFVRGGKGAIVVARGVRHPTDSANRHHRAGDGGFGRRARHEAPKGQPAVATAELRLSGPVLTAGDVEGHVDPLGVAREHSGDGGTQRTRGGNGLGAGNPDPGVGQIRRERGLCLADGLDIGEILDDDPWADELATIVDFAGRAAHDPHFGIDEPLELLCGRTEFDPDREYVVRSCLELHERAHRSGREHRSCRSTHR